MPAIPMTSASTPWHAKCLTGEGMDEDKAGCLLIVGVVILTVLISAVVAKVRYDWCVETGLTHEQCMFAVSCGG